jgi:PAS domain S-box-containing protein
MEKKSPNKRVASKSKISRSKKARKSSQKKSVSGQQVEKLVRERTRELLESEEMYRLVVETSPNVVFIARKDRLIYVNPAMVRLIGMNKEELLMMPVAELIQHYIAPEYRELVAKNFLHRLAGKDIGEYEIEAIDRDGARHNMIVKSQLITYQGEPAEMGLFVDITEHRRMEERIRLLYQAIDQSLDGIAVADLSGYIIFANRAWADMHGREIKNIIGRHLGIFHSSNQLERQVKPFIDTVIERGALQGEIDHRRVDGTEFTTWMSVTLLRNDKGEPVGTIAVARDITERKETEDKAIRSERLATAGLIASGIAHEINNPLTAIYASAQMLASELRDAPETVRNKMEKILSGSERIRELMKDFLTFARPVVSEEKIEVDIGEVLMQSIMMTSHLKKRGTEVKTILKPDLPGVVADPNQLSTIFTNLLINAHQALETRGDLIEVETCQRGQEWIEIIIRDNGIGIPPELGDRIFEPFFTTKSSEKGTGLGLAIVHSILSSLGGNISFKSEPGAMTEFFVRIPLGK